MSDEPKPNIPLLRKAVEWVEQEAAKPEIDREWDQSAWRRAPELRAHSLLLYSEYWESKERTDQVAAHCGTAYCVAGYVGQMLDERFKNSEVIQVEGEPVHVADFAKDALGLTDEQSEWLFAGVNTAEDVRRIAEEIAGERL